MKRIRLKINTEKSIAEGFDEFIDRCISKNLRPATLKHYTYGWKQISRYIDVNIKIRSISKKTFNDVIVAMKRDNITNQTLYTYARDLKTILYFFMEQDYM